jgi:hypothetical protein
MRIGLVAIRAGVVGNRSFEIATLVTAPARNIDVLAQQGKVGLRVIEGHGEVRFFKGGGGVAGIASLLEFALVRISMAIRTVRERQASVANLAIGPGRVAALTQHIAMLSRQRKARFRMVEVLSVDAGYFPINGRMTPGAIASEAALVVVFVASPARGR